MSNYFLIKNFTFYGFGDVTFPLYHIQVDGDHYVNFCNKGDSIMTITFDFEEAVMFDKTFTRDVDHNELFGIRLHGVWYKKPFNLKIMFGKEILVDEQIYW